MSADGTWKVTIKTPMGAQATTMTLATSGSDLTGSLDAPPPLGKVDFIDGVADGDNLTWGARVTTPMALALQFSAKVDGDAISGDVKMGSFGTSTFEGVRG